MSGPPGSDSVSGPAPVRAGLAIQYRTGLPSHSAQAISRLVFSPHVAARIHDAHLVGQANPMHGHVSESPLKVRGVGYPVIVGQIGGLNMPRLITAKPSIVSRC